MLQNDLYFYLALPVVCALSLHPQGHGAQAEEDLYQVGWLKQRDSSRTSDFWEKKRFEELVEGLYLEIEAVVSGEVDA